MRLIKGECRRVHDPATPLLFPRMVDELEIFKIACATYCSFTKLLLANLIKHVYRSINPDFLK